MDLFVEVHGGLGLRHLYAASQRLGSVSARGSLRPVKRFSGVQQRCDNILCNSFLQGEPHRELALKVLLPSCPRMCSQQGGHHRQRSASLGTVMKGHASSCITGGSAAAVRCQEGDNNSQRGAVCHRNVDG